MLQSLRHEPPNLDRQGTKLLALEQHVTIWIHAPEQREPNRLLAVGDGRLDVVPPLLCPADQLAVNPKLNPDSPCAIISWS